MRGLAGRAAAGPGGFEGEPASRQGKLVFKIDEKPFPCEGRGEGLCGVGPGYRSPWGSLPVSALCCRRNQATAGLAAVGLGRASRFNGGGGGGAKAPFSLCWP